MYITQVNSTPPQQSFGFRYPAAKRRETIRKLQERVVKLPEYSAELVAVIVESPNTQLLPKVKADYARVRKFYTQQLTKLTRAKDGISNIAFSNWAGNLINSVLNTECAISNRARRAAQQH